MSSMPAVGGSHSLRAQIAAILPSLPGWTTVEKGLRLAELIVETRALVSVEIGVFGGRGTIALALGHQEIDRGQVFAIDPWEKAASLEGGNDPQNDAWWGAVDHEAIFRDFLRAVLSCGVAPQCHVIRARSDVAVSLFADGSIDILHQDGNHSQEVSAAEVELWAPKLRRGGCWVMDDVLWPTTQRAQEMLAARGFLVVEDHREWRLYRRP